MYGSFPPCHVLITSHHLQQLEVVGTDIAEYSRCSRGSLSGSRFGHPIPVGTDSNPSAGTTLTLRDIGRDGLNSGS